MVARGYKQREAGDSAPETDQRLSQRKRPETGRFLLRVDRQTKGSYATAELAEAAGMAIKTSFPQVQVDVYDSAESRNTIVELPAPTQ